MILTHPWARLIGIDRIIELHAEGIKRYGGHPTPDPAHGCLERSLGAAWNAELYQGAGEGLPGLCFAGCLLFYIANNNCFVDGNKRTAWMSAIDVLLGLDLTVDVSEDEAYDYCISILDGTVENATDVSLWLADRLAAIEDS